MTPKETAVYNAAYYQANKQKLDALNRAWNKANPERRAAIQSAWNKANSEYYAAYRRSRRKTDPAFRIRENLRTRLNMAVRGNFKAGSAVNDLGISISEFKEYIAVKFLSGMSWDNWGEWHLDHIIPLAAFDLTDRGQFLKVMHYTNYQPLWAKDNLQKGDSQ